MRYRQDDEHPSLDRAVSWPSIAIVAIGIALRLWQYLGRASLWTDEAAIANNIVGRPLVQLLTTPLGHNQAAPVGFLLIEKLAVSTFGAGELALRAYPLACSLLSLVLLWRVAHRLLPRAAEPIVLAPFAFAPLLIAHAAEVKQYSSDVAVSLALLLAALDASDRVARGELSLRRAVVAALVGALAVWLSQPAVLVVTGLGAALAIGALASRGPRSMVPLALTIGAWGASALAATTVSMQQLSPAAQQYMRTFWNDGFWPLSLHHPSSVAWPMLHTALMLGSQLGMPTGIGLACALLAVGGIAAICKIEWRTSLLLVLPLLVALGASAARMYPFAERLALYLIPSLLLLAAIGVSELALLVRVKGGSTLVLATATIFVLVVEAQSLHRAPPVYRREEIAPAIAHLRRASLASDASYVYYGAVPAYDYYNARDPLPARATIGRCHRGDAGAYLAELDAMRGRARLWLLFAHELPRLHEREIMLAHLDSLGTIRDSLTVVGRDTNGSDTFVRLYLYDLSATHPDRSIRVARSAPTTVEPRLQCAPASE